MMCCRRCWTGSQKVDRPQSMAAPSDLLSPACRARHSTTGPEPAEQYKAVAQGFLANFGTWSVNEGDKTLTRHYQASMFPDYEGTDNKMSVSIVGDELTLVNPNPRADQDYGRSVNVYRRVK